MPLPVLIGIGAAVARVGLTAATLSPLVKPAVGFAKRFITQATARPGIGSAVTKGPLKLGKQTLIGGTSNATKALRVAMVAGGVGGLATVASHRRASEQRSPATAPSPRRSAPTPKATSTSERKCCPVGTKRMVCFKRGKVKKESRAQASARKARTKARARLAKEKAKTAAARKARKRRK